MKTKKILFGLLSIVCFGFSVFAITSCKHEHLWNDGEVVTPATCTTDGEMKFTCSDCDEIKFEVITALGHTVVIDAAVAATCTTTGLTEGKHCSECKEVLVEQEEVAALGHHYENDLCSQCGSNYYTDGLEFTLSSDSYVVTGYTGSDLNVVIPATFKRKVVTSIGANAFRNCRSLTSVVIPDSVTSIGSDAFCGCSSLTSITIPDSVTSIGSSAFKWCYSLTSLTIGNGVTSIGDYAFNWCDSLTSLTIGNGVTSIGSSAFEGCSSLKMVYYTGTIENWCNITFDSFSSNPMDNGATFYMLDENKNYCKVTNLVIPDSVTSIGDYAFDNCDSLTSITIPDSVTSIGNGAFYDCSSLTSVVIGISVTSIGDYAFEWCYSLTSLTIGNGVTSIGDYAFFGCGSLKMVYYTGTIENWCNITFGSFSSNPMDNGATFYMLDENKNYCKVTNLVIPDSVTSIGSDAFCGCSSLTSITIPDSVTSIDYKAFAHCSSLTSVVIGNSVTSIGDYAFEGCSSLKMVYYTGTIENWCNITFGSFSSNPLHNGATFYMLDENKNYYKVTNLVIPDSVTSIGDYAFEGCSSLKSVTIGNYVKSIDYMAFSHCSSLTSVVIGNSVTSIGDYAFEGCSSLTSITIPDSVTSIGNGAFYDCSSLTSVVIGISVTSIGDYAFDWCDSLKTVYYTGTEKEWTTITIYSANSHLTSATIIYNYVEE